MSASFSLPILVLLVMAAWCDVATRTIPNAIGLLIFVSGAVARALMGPSALAFSAGTAVLVFVVLTIIYSRGLIGGGDVKIMSSLAVGLTPLDVYRFVIVTALAGGVMGISYLLLSRRLVATNCPARKSLLARIIAVEAWRIRRRYPLPYGVAIAAGGAFVLLHPGSF